MSSSAPRGGGLRARLSSMRARLLAGGFVLVFCIWSVDTLGKDHGPKKAAGAQTAPAAGAFVIADPPDRAALDRFLADAEAQADPLAVDVLRDPFSAPADWAAIPPPPLRSAESQPVEEPAVTDASTPAESKDRPFAELHQLQGVILGARPLALIDGNGYRMGDRIDGYRIVALHRDRVELAGRGGRVVLQIAGPNLGPARNSP